MVKTLNKQHDQELRQAVKIWRLNSGVAMMQYETQEKSLIMARAMTKVIRKGLNHKKLQLY